MGHLSLLELMAACGHLSLLFSWLGWERRDRREGRVDTGSEVCVGEVRRKEKGGRVKWEWGCISTSWAGWEWKGGWTLDLRSRTLPHPTCTPPTIPT